MWMHSRCWCYKHTFLPELDICSCSPFSKLLCNIDFTFKKRGGCSVNLWMINKFSIKIENWRIWRSWDINFGMSFIKPGSVYVPYLATPLQSIWPLRLCLSQTDVHYFTLTGLYGKMAAIQLQFYVKIAIDIKNTSIDDAVRFFWTVMICQHMFM